MNHMPVGSGAIFQAHQGGLYIHVIRTGQNRYKIFIGRGDVMFYPNRLLRNRPQSVHRYVLTRAEFLAYEPLLRQRAAWMPVNMSPENRRRTPRSFRN